jgi:hypothetical protein
MEQDQLIEEETLPEHCPDHFYPVHLGELFNDRFRTVAKLGYGSSSTVWLARDLLWENHLRTHGILLSMPSRCHQYVALKIYIHDSAQHRELPVYQHFATVLPSQ